MDDQRNIIIAVVLMAVVWLGYSFFFPPTPAPTGPSGEAVLSPAPAAVSSTPDPSPVAVPESVTATTLPAQEEVPVREIVVENSRYRAVFSTSGARLLALELKDYHTKADPASPLVDLVGVQNPGEATLRTSGADGLGLPPDLVYALPEAIGETLSLGDGETREVAFVARTAEGLEITKNFLFHEDRFDLQLTTVLRNRGSSTQRGVLQLGLVTFLDDSREKSQYTFEGPVTLVGEELETIDVDDLEEEGPKAFSQPVWSGFETKYFLGAGVPLEGGASKVEIRKAGNTVENVFHSPPITLAPGEEAVQQHLLYFGPRDLDVLETVNHRLAEAIDFGFFSPIALPLLHVLKFFYTFVGNYGVCIILLTVIIKLLFWPLTQKSYSSMKAMQKLQPEMQKIRERFKNDRERLNKEIMEMYKSHRVNPLGGCLPMLVQIPVFFALYKVLLGSIELRHASFALWITDLSAKDPYYITPLIMGASMFVQQKMSPSTMDPTQARLFMAMPVVFTFLFLNFPSGLVLYWLVNNLLTIGQQYLINRKPA